MNNIKKFSLFVCLIANLTFNASENINQEVGQLITSIEDSLDNITSEESESYKKRGCVNSSEAQSPEYSRFTVEAQGIRDQKLSLMERIANLQSQYNEIKKPSMDSTVQYLSAMNVFSLEGQALAQKSQNLADRISTAIAVGTITQRQQENLAAIVKQR